ncbi:hypothetical protein HELRODRAFT_92428, partial [Helobdella robusta]|uniref:FAD-dependent oxidoreductase domain-containing protein 1 n=1 Tax=Helobdella robusta TaxID=6412 RepID=T1G8G1_HELRO
AMVLNCAGAWSSEIAKMAGIGVEKEGPLSFALPVEPRLRYVYVFHCPDGPGLQTPMLIDPSGVYVRREGLGGMYVCGASPPQGEPEPDPNQTVADEEFFKNHIWPALARRVPAFECLKVGLLSFLY